MKEKASVERIRKFIEKIVQKADVGEYVVKTLHFDDEGESSLVFNIEISEGSNMLIGQNGENLRSWQYLIRLLVRKHLSEDAHIPFLVDINGYRRQKDLAVFESAIRAAQEAKRERKAVMMRPMGSYERRLVHLRLSLDREVSTESIGEGSVRKVVVRPTGLQESE
jgi:spoIIIJ-associated protein